MKCLLYISYEQEDYVERFHLAIDGQMELSHIALEDIGDIFTKVRECCPEGSKIDWYLIADTDAQDFDFESIFAGNGFKLSCASEWKDSEICDFLGDNFPAKFSMDENGVAIGGKAIKRIYPQIGQNKSPLNIPDVIKKVEDHIEPENRAEKMTELARIILAKYGKDEKNE